MFAVSLAAHCCWDGAIKIGIKIITLLIPIFD